MAIAAPDGSTRWQGVALGPGDDCVRSGGRWQLQHPVLGLIAGHRLKGFGAPLLVVERQLQMNVPVYSLVHFPTQRRQTSPIGQVLKTEVKGKSRGKACRTLQSKP